MGTLGDFRSELDSWNLTGGGGPERILIPVEVPMTLKSQPYLQNKMAPLILSFFWRL